MFNSVLSSTAAVSSSGWVSDTAAFDALQSEPSPYPLSWGDVDDELLHILELDDNWDGMGAITPDKRLVAGCFEFARWLRNKADFAPPDIVRASPDGNVCLEWQWDEGCVEAEVSIDTVDWIISGPSLQTSSCSNPFVASEH